MKTTFDLPDSLLRRAKAAAAAQGRPLRDLVAEAIETRLAAPPPPPPQRRSEPPPDEWQAYLSTLELQPDGSYINPNGIDDPAFYQALEEIRSGRLQEQAALFEPTAPPAPPARAPRKPRTKA
jgi:hypothetical protein